MGILFGHQTQESRNTHHDLKKPTIEIYQQLKCQQKILEC